MVVNPAAGGGRTARRWPLLREEMRRAGLTFEVAETSGPGDATALARAAAASWPLVVAVGGDGTVNEVVNGLVDGEGDSLAALGVVATGRGRDFCRNLGVPLEPTAAVRRLVDGAETRIDLGAVERSGAPPRYFVNAAGAGFDAAVAARLHGRGGGRGAYLLGVLETLHAHRPTAATVTADGETWSGAVTAIVAANGACYGGGMRIAPGADPTDGRLDVVTIAGLGRGALLAWLPTIYPGWHLLGRHASLRRARTLRIDAAAPLPVHVDGEPFGTTPADVTVRPRALRLVR